MSLAALGLPGKLQGDGFLIQSAGGAIGSVQVPGLLAKDTVTATNATQGVSALAVHAPDIFNTATPPAVVPGNSFAFYASNSNTTPLNGLTDNALDIYGYVNKAPTGATGDYRVAQAYQAGTTAHGIWSSNFALGSDTARVGSVTVSAATGGIAGAAQTACTSVTAASKVLFFPMGTGTAINAAGGAHLASSASYVLAPGVGFTYQGNTNVAIGTVLGYLVI
jgi:hypothetical protein